MILIPPPKREQSSTRITQRGPSHWRDRVSKMASTTAANNKTTSLLDRCPNKGFLNCFVHGFLKQICLDALKSIPCHAIHSSPEHSLTCSSSFARLNRYISLRILSASILNIPAIINGNPKKKANSLLTMNPSAPEFEHTHCAPIPDGKELRPRIERYI